MDYDVKTKNNEEIAHFFNASDRIIKEMLVLNTYAISTFAQSVILKRTEIWK